MKVVIAAAGTGGHINPGIAIANKIKSEQMILFRTGFEENFEEELPFLSTNEEMILLIELAEKYYYQLDTIIRSFSDDFEKEVPLLIFKRK